MHLFAFTLVLCYAFAQEDYSPEGRLVSFEEDILQKIMNMNEKVETENEAIKKRMDAEDCDGRIAELTKTLDTTNQEVKEQLETLLRLKDSIYEAQTSNYTLTRDLQYFDLFTMKLKLELNLLSAKLADLKSWRELGRAQECFGFFKISENLIQPRAGISSSWLGTGLNMNKDGNFTARIEVLRQSVPNENHKLIDATIGQIHLTNYERNMKQDCEDRIKALDEEIKKALVNENSTALSIQNAEDTLKNLNDVLKNKTDEVEIHNAAVESLRKEIIRVKEELTVYSQDARCYDLLEHFMPG